MTEGVRIRCNLGGCWLECDRCGVLDQGDSPASMERMKRTEKSHICADPSDQEADR